MFSGFQNTANAVQAALGGTTQSAITTAQTILLNTNSTAGSPELQAGGIPVVLSTNYPTTLRHGIATNGDETWPDVGLLIAMNMAYTQAAYNYRI